MLFSNHNLERKLIYFWACGLLRAVWNICIYRSEAFFWYSTNNSCLDLCFTCVHCYSSCCSVPCPVYNILNEHGRSSLTRGDDGLVISLCYSLYSVSPNLKLAVGTLSPVSPFAGTCFSEIYSWATLSLHPRLTASYF